MILLLVGLLRHPVGRRPGTRLDLATVMAGAATAGPLLVTLPTGPRDVLWGLELAVTLLIQPGIFLVVVFAVVRLVMSGRSPFTRTAGLLNGLAARDGQFGLETMCVGGGQGMAIIYERLS
jgi:acetyl-CoA acetyltransferase